MAQIIRLLALLTFAISANAAPHSSEAQLSNAPNEVFRSANQPNRMVASMAAKQQCERAKGIRAGYCEIISMDDESIGRAIDLKPQSAEHPLFLWRYTRGAATIYLAGTVHVLKEGFFPLPRQYEQAFEATEKLVVEAAVDQIEPAQLQQMMLKYAQLPAGTLRDLLSPKTYALLAEQAQTYGLPLEQMQGFKPALISQQLALAAISAMGYDPTLGVESHFSARTEPQNILELESVESQLKLLFDQPIEAQIVLLQEALAEFNHIAEQTDAMLAAWAHGDDEAVATLMREQTGESAAAQEFLHQLLDQRNTHMARRIAKMLRGTGSYFVLVGSAHLAGNQSVITELKKLGFNGQRISSTDSISN